MVMPLFPILGVVFLVWFKVARNRARRLLEQGLLAEALVTSVVATTVRASKAGGYVHKIGLRRTDSPSGGSFLLRTDQAEVIRFAQDRMDSHQPVFVLYDPAQPKNALLPETL